MNGTRLVIWVVGLALVVLAVFLLFFETGLSDFVPAGIALAGLLLIIGVAVMSMSEKMHTDRTHAHEPRERVIREETVHHDTEPVRETRVIERGHH